MSCSVAPRSWGASRWRSAEDPRKRRAELPARGLDHVLIGQAEVDARCNETRCLELADHDAWLDAMMARRALRGLHREVDHEHESVRSERRVQLLRVGRALGDVVPRV